MRDLEVQVVKKLSSAIRPIKIRAMRPAYQIEAKQVRNPHGALVGYTTSQ